MKGCVFMEIQQEKRQLLTLESRERLTVNLVENVEHFAPAETVLKTALGRLRILGAGLKLEDLSKDGGAVSLTGKIDSLSFSEIREKRSFFKDMLK